jgi:hypothetical protein
MMEFLLVLMLAGQPTPSVQTVLVDSAAGCDKMGQYHVGVNDKGTNLNSAPRSRYICMKKY